MNELKHESSPYLKQHADNPVHWHAWNEKTLALAKSLNKPILLSVGYSSCHWCHVMAHESFENPEVAELMNANFVNIKVDREERPDLDQIYQNVAQIFTHSGGWPLTVFLTPDLKPFYGGTYFPPVDRWQRPGFGRLVQALGEAYRNDSEKVLENSQKIMEAIEGLETVAIQKDFNLSWGALHTAAEKLLGILDSAHGGFGSAPKFPNASALTFLLRMGLLRKTPTDLLIHSLDSMLRRGLFDQIRGGFHRYSVDAEWAVPHFEKMLYDNGGLLKLYSEAIIYNQTPGPLHGFLGDERAQFYASRMAMLIEWLEIEMTAPNELFYSAQDADSDGEEGKFFVWNPDELKQALGEKQGKIAARLLGVSDFGNFEDSGKSVLAFPIETLSEEENAAWPLIQESLLKARATRVRPGLDDKILTSWNALMIQGLAAWSKALHSLGQVSRAAEIETRAIRLLEKCLKSVHQGRAFAVIHDDLSGRLQGYLDDHAYLGQACLDLGKIDEARDLFKMIEKHFKDAEGAGYFFTADDHERLIQRPKTIFDQAMPSGNAVALSVMVALEISSPELDSLVGTAVQSPFGQAELLNTGLLAQVGIEVVEGAVSTQDMRWFYQRPEKKQRAEVQLCSRGVCHLSPAASFIQDSLEYKLAEQAKENRKS